MSGHLRRAWESYRERVLHADAGPVQVRETEMAFYAGAHAMFTTVVGDLSAGPDPTPEDESLMKSLWDELREFRARYGATL